MAEVLDDDAVSAAIGTLDGWSGSRSEISRTAALASFMAAIGVVDKVAAVAEQMDHHPDIDIRWRTLTFRCSTHSAGGVTDNDIALARHIDEIISQST